MPLVSWFLIVSGTMLTMVFPHTSKAVWILQKSASATLLSPPWLGTITAGFPWSLVAAQCVSGSTLNCCGCDTSGVAPSCFFFLLFLQTLLCCIVAVKLVILFHDVLVQLSLNFVFNHVCSSCFTYSSFIISTVSKHKNIHAGL